MPSASTNRRPIPGQPKMVSVRIAPPINNPNCSPMTVMMVTGNAALAFRRTSAQLSPPKFRE